LPLVFVKMRINLTFKMRMVRKSEGSDGKLIFGVALRVIEWTAKKYCRGGNLPPAFWSSKSEVFVGTVGFLTVVLIFRDCIVGARFIAPF